MTDDIQRRQMEKLAQKLGMTKQQMLEIKRSLQAKLKN